VDELTEFRRDAIGRLRRLRSAPDPEQVLGLGDIAAGFQQRLLAFHHAQPGTAAQFHHLARAYFRHR